ncbi:MASE3 domain-containing protein [Bacillus sp. PS06]|uniref:MASE3 domain-containing protein n=1 Tax=Bacillus sp. PS06 TaxID=2764176 RepID=UPI00177FFE78|nr:MASE3 domain-containing protein [Bacillus sp. PS06]MBD8069477.1 PAS domain S-box protein [Bacillus sp. PS06]
MDELNVRKSSKVVINLFLALFIVYLINLLYIPLHDLYKGVNHLSFHTFLELFSIFVCFSISSYGWHAYNDTKMMSSLWIPSVFFAVGFLDLLHTLSYPGMPHFITDASIAKTSWFWIFARFTATFSFFYLVILKDRVSPVQSRKLFMAGTLIYTLLLSFIVIKFEDQLPLLSDGQPSVLKDSFEYLISSILLLSIIIVTKRYLKTKTASELDLVLAFSFLFISEVMIIAYSSMLDFKIIISHICKAVGYGYIFKYFYFSKMELSFKQKSEVETSLKLTQGLLESVFINTADSIIILNNEKKIVRVNETFSRIFKQPKELVLGLTLAEVIPEHMAKIEKTIAQMIRQNVMTESKIIAQKKGNQVHYLKHTVFPVTSDYGENIYTVIITRDITKQVQDEERIRSAQQELKETAKLQQGTIFKFKRIQSRFIFTLCEGHLLKVISPNGTNLVGKDIEHYFSPEVIKRGLPFFKRAWNGEEVSFDIIIQKRNLIVTLKPVKRKGYVLEVIGSSLDVTQLKQTEALLQKSEKLALVGELAAGLAHEIRNPLTALKGFTQLLDSTSNQANKNYINIMLGELDRLESITNEFMVVAKPQAIKYEIYDLKNLIHSVCVFAGPQALMNNVDMHVAFHTSNTSVYSDVNQLKQVLINLIKNSFEAMPNGGTLGIELDQVEESHLTIRITDNGSGIPKEIIPKLGEPFYTLKEKGTGLGLMVSFRIIEAHKGTIQFESEENVGTTVEIRLPLAKEEQINHEHKSAKTSLPS